MHALYRNHMGNDLEVVNDARISFAATTDAMDWQAISIPNPCTSLQRREQTQTLIPQLSAQDKNLIGFLARGCRSGEWENAITDLQGSVLTDMEVRQLMMWAKRMPTHWTPFGQQTIKLRMKAPVPIRTQCFKSKIGFVENEESRRYISSTPELFTPEFRSAPENDIKQGSGDLHPGNAHWKRVYEEQCNAAIRTYEAMIEAKIAPEQARLALPQGVHVNWVWTGSLYAFAEFYNKRSDRNHSQGEVADLADAIAPIISTLFPVSWTALTGGA